MKTHYDVLGLDPSADVEAVKTAFRREIARYHPDKVSHLGAEFQEMASTRASALTAAYKVLTDPKARAEYDACLRDGSAADEPLSPSATPPPPVVPAAADEPLPSTTSLDEERASRDDILRRATMLRVREALRQALGDCDTPEVKGFDLASIQRTRRVASRTVSELLTSQASLIVLTRIADTVDAAVATDAFRQAVRARLEGQDTPIILLLIGNRLASSNELSYAIERARTKSPVSQHRIFPVPVDVHDWSARIPLNAPEVVRSFVDRLKSSV